MAKERRRKNGSGSKNENRNGVDWAFVERCLASDRLRTIYLWGPPGTGKSYAAYHKGRVGDGLFAMTLTDDTPAAELRGFFRPSERGMVWQDGPLISAMRVGARCVINEISNASPDVLALLYPVLDAKETARLTLPTGETVVPAEGFSCVVTDNAGPDVLPAALQDRFDCRLEVLEPHPEALARLPEHLREAAARTYDLEPERALSIRAWLSVANLEPVFGLLDACRAVFGAERGVRVHEGLMMRQMAF